MVMVETAVLPGIDKAVVLVHDGIGCCKLWGTFPYEIYKATGKTVFSYSRHNHGLSDNKVGFDYHEEVDTLHSLLQKTGIENPTMFGHSDGAAIALLYAAKYQAKKVVVSAPHVKYEESMLYPLTRLRERFEAGGMPELAASHKDADNMFYSWYNRVTSEEFKSFDITESLKSIICPVEAMRFIADPYSTNHQLSWLCEVVPQTHVTLMSGNNHTIHKRYPDVITNKL
jgi:pimeloyl-ACP methyl ester carboxylesterase